MSATVRVVSYNLLHGMHLARRGAIDLPAVAAVLAAIDADVVALQEVDHDQERSGHVDQTTELARLLGMHGVFCAALRGSPDHTWTPAAPDQSGPAAPAASGPAYGVGLLSRLPLSDVRRVALPGGGAGNRGPNASLRNPGWDHEPRVALSARVATPHPLEVLVTHLSYMPWRAARQLRAAMAAARRTPALLVGDLNLPATAVRALTATPEAAVRAPAAWRHAGGEPTYPAWRPRLQMHHVLVRGPVTVTRVAAHPTSTSDHRPLVVDLRSSHDEG